MQTTIILAVVFGLCRAQNVQTGQEGNARYVFDYFKNLPPLDAEAVVSLLEIAQPGETFPLLRSVPETGFDCNAFSGPGYYADSSTLSRCQAFYRCDLNGNKTGFLCPNETLFNQLTLTCDYYFNVDCAAFKTFNNYGNSRLYKDQPLFDSPPKGYVSALSGLPQFGQEDARQPNSPAIASRPVVVRVISNATSKLPISSSSSTTEKSTITKAPSTTKKITTTQTPTTTTVTKAVPEDTTSPSEAPVSESSVSPVQEAAATVPAVKVVIVAVSEVTAVTEETTQQTTKPLQTRPAVVIILETLNATASTTTPELADEETTYAEPVSVPATETTTRQAVVVLLDNANTAEPAVLDSSTIVEVVTEAPPSSLFLAVGPGKNLMP